MHDDKVDNATAWPGSRSQVDDARCAIRVGSTRIAHMTSST